ncbi:MAG TPA: hypothetical protein PLS29_00270 [Acidimicrobiales bacterium]|nr:MAG: hypothetical protein B7Z69_02375 [Actinobacteria bacterium 21-73-9]HQU25441.1 hypothetical protein [Acidimicrobiales bacterium]
MRGRSLPWIAAGALVLAALVLGGPASAGVRTASRPYACSPALRAPGPAGRAELVTASLGATRATLAARSGGGLAQVLAGLRVVVRGPSATVVRPVPKVVTYLLTRGSQVCRVAGTPAPSVIVLAYSGGAHCCDSALGFAASATGVARPLARVDLADFAALRSDRGHVVVRAGEGAFPYTLDNYAMSSEPILLESFDGRAFVNVTRDYPDLVRADARTWDRLFARYPSDLSYLAGWVADESLLGRGASAWRRVATLRSEGRLHGTVGYPSGRGFERQLRAILRARHYPSS